MIKIRNVNERGHFQNHWLDSQHSFSFAEYYDPEHMGVSVLRVINDDKVSPGAGFPTHGHNNMEIVSYVLEGELEHRDSMGNGSVIRPGDVQRMSAGTGVTHLEFNPSNQDGTNFLQIWLLPNARGIKPEYEQKYFSPQKKQGQLKLLVSPNGQRGSISAHSDALLFGTLLENRQSVTHVLDVNRVAYMHVARGRVNINGETLNAGDGATISDEKDVTLEGVDSVEVLLFDLPATRHYLEERMMKNPTDHPIHELLGARWSPYVFDAAKEVSTDDQNGLFEAARWTMSSYNAQPWRYIVGVKGRSEEVWQQIHEVLLEGNQPWAHQAPVLALGLAEHNFEYNAKPNKAALRDLGAASANLTFEATARGLAVHQMIGIDPDKARRVFSLPKSVEPLTALAIGYAGRAQQTNDEFAQRDARPRERKPLNDIIIQGGW